LGRLARECRRREERKGDESERDFHFAYES
jgi:hypothetical protein